MRISDWSSDVCSSDLNDALRFRDERLLVRPQPIGERIGLAHVASQRIGLAGADHGFEDRPDRGGIILRGGADDHPAKGATIASVTRSGRPLALSSSAHTVRARKWTLPPSPVNSMKRSHFTPCGLSATPVRAVTVSPGPSARR